MERKKIPAAVRRSPSAIMAVEAVRAASEGDIQKLATLLEKGVDLDRGDPDQRTPLHSAASKGHVDVIEFLLDQGVNLDPKDRWGLNPIFSAIKRDNKEAAELLKARFAESFRGKPWSSENDCAELVLVHDLIQIGGHISQNLYDLTDSGVGAYKAFCETLKAKDIRVITVQDVVLCSHGTPEFEQFIDGQITVNHTDPSITLEEVAAFKKKVVSGMNIDQLAHAITHCIHFNVVRGREGDLMARSYEIFPLLELLQVRNQIFTSRGVVLGGRQELRPFTKVLKFVFQKMGFRIAAQLPEPLNLNGGDFIPAGPDLVFFGTGEGTEEASVRYLLEKDVFDAERVAVVRDLFDRSEKRKTLDSVFKIVSKGCALMLESIIGEDNLRRRLVTEYVRVAPKIYVKSRTDVEFYQYVSEQGLHVIKFPAELHETGGLSIYNLGMGRLLTLNQDIADLIQGSPAFDGQVEVLDSKHSLAYDFTSMTSLIFRRDTEGSVKVQNPKPLAMKKRNLAALVWDSRVNLDGKLRQNTNTILMVAPVGFQTNEETLQDNYFMHRTATSSVQIEKQALLEFSGFHKKLVLAGVNVVLYSSERFHRTPDAVFPNNWFSTHSAQEMGGQSTLILYPMKTVSRRAERRQNIISELQDVYDRQLTFTQWENSDFPHFLESTGVLVKDRVRKIAYAALSQRCYRQIAEKWAQSVGYQLCLFKAVDAHGRPIYHTNVMMSVGSSVAVVCLDSIPNLEERKKLMDTLEQSHEIIAITQEQTNQFCGNILEVSGRDENRIMVMSTRAYNSFTEEQKERMLKHVDQILHADIPTIENIGGGGVRCMMGELY
ncbi:Amidinotransferase [Balamuthia mandrillaris]